MENTKNSIIETTTNPTKEDTKQEEMSREEMILCLDAAFRNGVDSDGKPIGIDSTEGSTTGGTGGNTDKKKSALPYKHFDDMTSAWTDAIRKYIIHPFSRRVTVDRLLDPVAAENIKGDILKIIRRNISAAISHTPKGAFCPVKQPTRLDAEAAWRLICSTGDAAIIREEEGSGADLVFYHHTGSNAGIWKSDRTPEHVTLMKIGANLGLTIDQQGKIYKPLLSNLHEIKPTTDHRFVPCRNGVVDLEGVQTTFSGLNDWTATGFDFTPYVCDTGDLFGEENPDYVKKYGDMHFTWKLDTDFNPTATNVVMTAPDGYMWSVEDHFKQVLGNEKAIRTVWEQWNFGFRGTNGGFSYWYIDGSENSKGGGAKSTTAAMAAKVFGEQLVYMIDMDDTGGRFSLAGVGGKKYILGNETNADHQALVNTKIIKQLSRQEAIRTEQKFDPVKTVTFRGMQVQCMNGLPRLKEKNFAFFRKIAIVEFPAMLTTDKDRSYIQDDYINRKEVREYVLFKALSLGNITEYTKECRQSGDQYIKKIRSASSTVYAFMEEITPDISGDKIPVNALWDAYRENWSKLNGYTGTNKETFNSDLRSWCGEADTWEFVEKPGKIPKDAPPETFLEEYGGGNWSQGCGHWTDKVKGKTIRNFIIRKGRTAPKDKTKPCIYTKRNEYLYCMYVLSLHFMDPTTNQPSFKEWVAKGRPRPRFSLVQGVNPDTPQIKIEEFLSVDDEDGTTIKNND